MIKTGYSSMSESATTVSAKIKSGDWVVTALMNGGMSRPANLHVEKITNVRLEDNTFDSVLSGKPIKDRPICSVAFIAKSEADAQAWYNDHLGEDLRTIINKSSVTSKEAWDAYLR